MRIAVYPGSFDPVTMGHLDVIRRASKLFDKIIVAVLTNSAKRPAFAQQERVDMICRATAGMPNVEVVHFSGLLVDFCRRVGATVIVKGLRAVSDFEYEFQMALTNQQMDEHIDTVFLTTTAQYMYLSSSIVREVASLGGDISGFVPLEVKGTILQKLAPKPLADVGRKQD